MPDMNLPARNAAGSPARHFLDPVTGAIEPYVRASGSGTTRTDLSGTIASNGTAQQLAAANPNRRALGVQNTSAGDLRIRSTGVAGAAAGILIPPGALYEAPAHDVPLTAISVWGATAGQSYVAWEA